MTTMQLYWMPSGIVFFFGVLYAMIGVAWVVWRNHPYGADVASLPIVALCAALWPLIVLISHGIDLCRWLRRKLKGGKR